MTKKDKFKWLVAIGSVAIFALIIAPLIMTIIGGIIGTAVAIAIGAILNALIPAFSHWLTVLKFKSAKLVAAKAPIETMEKGLLNMRRSQETFRKKLDSQRASLEKFRSDVQKMIKDFPQDSEQYNRELSNFEKLIGFRVEKYKDLVVAISEAEKKLNRAKRRYAMALAAQEAGENMNADDKFMERLMQEIAEDTVDTEVQNAMAQMENAVLDDALILREIEQRKVHAVNYDQNGQVMLGNILAPVEVSK